MATTTRAKHRQLEEQQNNLSTDDKKYSEDQSLGYVSDNNIFTDIYNKENSSDNEEDNLQKISQISDHGNNQEFNQNISPELLILAKRKNQLEFQLNQNYYLFGNFFSNLVIEKSIVK
ncbi:6420_t:CDS:1 [Racocetra persica]|uniref:6420_t:CDS:1 n=1 Tax=Racocetra persica TaxID=160502 RepID=A0ACA9RXI9_9GLOM|nr:6420_t:CDS:1 [Racocetra persica]